MASVVTAVVAAVLYVGLVVVIIVLYYVDKTRLLPWGDQIEPSSTNATAETSQSINVSNVTKINNDTEQDNHDQTQLDLTFHIFGLAVADAAMLTLLTASLIVAILSLALLLHLFAFHLFIHRVGITTYEYIRAQRLEAERRVREEPQRGEAVGAADGKCCGDGKRVRPDEPALQKRRCCPCPCRGKNDVRLVNNGDRKRKRRGKKKGGDGQAEDEEARDEVFTITIERKADRESTAAMGESVNISLATSSAATATTSLLQSSGAESQQTENGQAETALRPSAVPKLPDIRLTRPTLERKVSSEPVEVGEKGHPEVNRRKRKRKNTPRPSSEQAGWLPGAARTPSVSPSNDQQ